MRNLTNLSPNAISRSAIAFVWLYHGLVPKLLGPHRDEIAMNQALGLGREAAVVMATTAGIAEILMAIAVVVFWRERWPMILTIIAMVGLLVYSLVLTPDLALGAFNPVTINVCVIALALVALSDSAGWSEKEFSE